MTEQGGGCSWLASDCVSSLDRHEPRGLRAAPPSEQLFAAQTGQAGLWGRPLGALCALAGGAASSL